MSKETTRTLFLCSLLLLVANWGLGFLDYFLSGTTYYVIKTGLLALIVFLAIHRPLRIKVPLQPKVGLLEQLRVNWLSLVYLFLISIPLLLLGLTKNQHYLPTALTVALGAGFIEEYLCRGILLQVALKDGIHSYKQVLQAVFVSSLIFGLAHLVNLRVQDLDVTLYQVYYATAMGVYFAAVVLRTGSLWWTIFIHFMIDLGTILATAGVESTSKPNGIAIGIWLVVMLIGLILIRPKQVQRLMATQTLANSEKIN
ncbi:CPBP family intramembrane metalloprotease [Streptococcus sp. zg-86]|uniref:CPBP family intramembrane metalloprotease n=1 Tax=Streptococcus zhangguiae TaxID=2664091 RepID=A0A6I4RCD1_9STRE|nr:MULTISPECIES: CPBP family intramembrane glutamic endopeptidase [unclassified Streptococcus]MTB63592.1 CPBP family intramembrane metalloprotease [Streptococcus sp. zg-86]MTB89759.1 CPBP family intramembrane metalloprotease [Streptococcus sp. zg-36]MWV55430.1 CPBP family intramembrane metalloprotease [Streptococcus sp. zg-70]QTH47626.1 CPBP family intramembrane metalloprotease [Streptococcus sp. zg-86]